MSSSSLLTLLAFIAVVAACVLRDKLWGKEKEIAKPYAYRRTLGGGETRDVIQKMANEDKNCMIFFGSQSGCAEDLAARLAKEGHSRFGLKTMVANLEDYDYNNLNEFPSNAVAMFVMATFGEGEPTDNAQDFCNFITDENVTFSNGGSSLSDLNFICFGVGNSTYEHFNAVSTKIDQTLERLGGHRIAPTGRGDDGEKTTEEDFLAWKETMWAALAKKMGLIEKEVIYEPVFHIIERKDLTCKDDKVYLGEPNQLSLQGTARGPFNSHNPYVAPVAASRDIFKEKGRNCMHIEIDLTGSGLTYETGDHISIFPVNPGVEVDRFLKVFGLAAKRDTVLDVKALERTAKVPFPVPTTYDTIVRYKLEICAPVSRQNIQQLAAFAPSATAKEEMLKLGADKDYFHAQVTARHLNIAQTLELVGEGATWSAVPFTMLIEGLLSLQPRPYSISSSSMVMKDRLTITTKVETHSIADTGFVFKGVTTNYLLALQQHQNHVPDADPPSATYAIYGPRNRYEGICLPLYIRPSTYRLPANPATPIIMVGPGTGVAPFRGFVQERAAQKKAGQVVGMTMLFYGCRKPEGDFIYEEDWKVSYDSADCLHTVTSIRSSHLPGVWGSPGHRLPHDHGLFSQCRWEESVCARQNPGARQRHQCLPP